jgi:YbbR domain-containing protein
MLKRIKKNINSMRFRRVKRLLTSKSFLGSFLFAASLWAYTSLSHEYTPFVKVPLSVKLPATKAIENPLPETISIKVKGGGWQLFYLIFFNTAKKCIVDISDKEILEDEYIVTRTDILKGIQNVVDVEPIDVLPESMKLKLGKVSTYFVPVSVAINVTPKEGFVALSELKIKPDSIGITGNEKVVKDIRFWATKKIDILNINHTQTISVELSDSLISIVKLSRKTVDVTVDIDLEADITIHDIPITIRGGTLPKNHKINPNKISVVVYGGIERLSTLNSKNISAYINYDDIMNDSTGVIIPTLNKIDGIAGFHITPKYIYHTKQVK